MDAKTLEAMANSAFQNAQATLDALYNANEAEIEIGEALEGEIAAAFLSGELVGKNEEERKAKSRVRFSAQLERLGKAKSSVRAARFHFDKAQTDLDTVKTLLRIAELGTHQ